MAKQIIDPIFFKEYEEENHLAPLVVGGLAAAQKVPQIASIVSKVGGAVGKVADTIGLGGVSQDRFIDRTEEAYKALDDAGYVSTPQKKWNQSYKDFRIGKSHVPDKKKKGNYAPEFQRLHDYIVARMNFFNPGLGTIYKQHFPQFTMANLGNIKSDGAWAAFKEFVKAYPAGTFDPALANVTPPSTVSLTPKAPTPPLPPVKQVTAPPPSPIQTSVQDETPNIIETKAGILKGGNMTTILLLVGVVILLFLFAKKA